MFTVDDYENWCDDIDYMCTQQNIWMDDIHVGLGKQGPEIKCTLDGDWKHTHLDFAHIVRKYFESKNLTPSIDKQEYPSDSDDYKADYTIRVEDDSEEVTTSDDVRYGANLVTL